MVRICFTTMHNIAHLLLVIGKDTAFHKNMQCHSLAVGHSKRCGETAFHKRCDITHFLLVKEDM